MYWRNYSLCMLSLLVVIRSVAQSAFALTWDAPVIINNMPVFKDAGKVKDAMDYFRYQGNYGSQYARMIILKNGNWLAGYTIARNNGYSKSPTGGLEIQISLSEDQGKHWKNLTIIADPGRDLDNTQMILLKDESILLACRSVRWQESYILPVFKSTDDGRSWIRFSVIDSVSGSPGSLGNPDKGIYEPHFNLLADGRLSVMYANEKHVTENPSYSQVISQKISDDNGQSWSKEIRVAYQPGHPDSRPGMPVWTKMKNGRYIVVYEICGPEKCQVHYKISENGTDWPTGLGTPIPDQIGGPYILALDEGELITTSNSGNISVSSDYGITWTKATRAWPRSFWATLYQTGPDRIVSLNSVFRKEGGNNIQIKSGKIKNSFYGR
jgi:hypothetical protein